MSSHCPVYVQMPWSAALILMLENCTILESETNLVLICLQELYKLIFALRDGMDTKNVNFCFQALHSTDFYILCSSLYASL